ncbi:MAG TPA: hypothetical protein VF131_02745 [Blastocatellia bacterium]|nr:hypothetical protein [Blastocatellia bacterium]
MIKKRLIYCAIALMVAGLCLTAAPSLADDHKKGDKKKGDDKSVTIKGEVIDQPCYEGKDGARGEGHKSCALACAKRGNQMAIIDESNTIYSIKGDYAANKNEKLIPFVASMVEAKGTVSEKDGKKWIDVSSIKPAETK